MISLAKAFDPSSAAAAELGHSSVARSTDNIFRTGAGANQAFN